MSAASSQPGLRTSRWLLFTLGAVVLSLLLYATWYAGKVAGGMEDERLSSQVDRLQQKVVANQLALHDQKQQVDSLKRALSTAGRGDSVALVTSLRKQLSESQAEANQYKEAIALEQKQAHDNATLLNALSSPGAHLLTFKASETAPTSTAYALIVESSKVVFVASNLPKPADGKQYQLWLLRRQDPKLVSAGVFSPDKQNSAVLDFNSSAVISDIAELEVTEEPDPDGSESPTGNKLMSTIATQPEKPEKMERSEAILSKQVF